MRGPNVSLTIDEVRHRWLRLPLPARLTIVAVIGALGAAGAGYLTSLNPFAQPANLAVVTRVVIVATPVLTGIYAQTNRLQVRMGSLLIAAGLYSAVWMLNGSANDIAFTAGALAAGISPVVFSVILLNHPQGRLSTRTEKRLATLAWGAVGPIWLTLLFVSPRAPLSSPLMRCGDHCPQNLLYLGWGPHGVQFVLIVATVIAWVTVSTATALLVIRRWRTGSPLVRIATAPVVLAAVLIPILMAEYLITRKIGWAGGRLVGVAYISVAVAVPLTILTGLSRERLYMAGALTRFLHTLARVPSADPQALMAATLGDPSLRIAYRRPNLNSYVSLDGLPVTLFREAGRRAVTFVDREQRPVAAVTYSPELRDQERFIQAAASVALMRLEAAQLEAELRASTADLHASRIRLVEAAHDERRRIERDLHDSVQQQLVGLRLTLGMAADTLSAEPELGAQMLSRVETQVDEILATLRSLARGIYPALLGERGVVAALTAAAQRMPISVRVDGPGCGRHSEDLEVAVYFCCLEALQNAVKHGGPETTAVVRLWRQDGALCFEVSDTGIGFDPDKTSTGRGLVNMRDRIEAIGGTLHISAAPGHGVCVRGAASAALATPLQRVL